MTRARCILPDTTHFITRKCSEDRFLLRPSWEVNTIFEYLLAEAARRHHIRLHAYCVLSNHYHLVVTDPGRTLPEFMQRLNSYTARALKLLHRKDKGCIYDPGSYNDVVLADAPAVLEKMAYTLANPVRAGLVARSADWPGAKSTTLREGAYRKLLYRPELYFDDTEEGAFTEKAYLHVEPPEAFRELHYDSDPDLLHDALRREEEEIHEERRKEKKGYLGRRAIVEQSPFASPKNPKEGGGIRPRVATRNPVLRAAFLKMLDDFLAAYRVALEDFAAKVRDVVFPAGTYKMRVHLRVLCADCADLAPG